MVARSDIAGHSASTIQKETPDRKWGRAQGPSFPSDPLPPARVSILRLPSLL